MGKRDMVVRTLFKKLNHFYDEHPYWGVLIAAAVGSVIGILIEYTVNDNFIGSAIYTVSFYSILMLLVGEGRKKK
ncbi:hypothetical protein PROCOU_06178 [Listeria rocourtiae FSL F6-920]|nr:hypothetical protein PROCOU_06178 [Listeria rocourtiae FSL F6-920]